MDRVIPATWVIYEPENRLVVGVDEESHVPDIRSRLAGMGIPSGAVEIKQIPYIQSTATLRDIVDPRIGGIKITEETASSCTMGFNVFGGYFVMNSHCTEETFRYDGNRVYQPTALSTIGDEWSDPYGNIGGACPAGMECRYSDAALIRYDIGIDSDVGVIASTSRGITIDPNEKYFIHDTANYPSTFENLTKVGQVSGEESGSVPFDGYCVDVAVESDRGLLCQYKMVAQQNNGDSGAPVFKVTGSTIGGQAVTLYGIAHGRDANNNTVFSAWGDIKFELNLTDSDVLY